MKEDTTFPARQANAFCGHANRPLVTVCVLNWNRKDDLLNCLQSIEAQTYNPIDILVVDNGSTDGSADAVEQEYPGIRVVRLDKNYGCPGGRNRSIPHSKGDFIFFVDNDGFLHKQAVERAVQAMSTNKRINIVSGRVKLFSSQEEVDIECNVGQENAGYFFESFSGGISLHRKSMYDVVGTYPDDYMYSGEESHMSYRIIDKGLLIYHEPTVILWHKKTDRARQKAKEAILRRANALATNAELWPIELVFIYGIRSLFIDVLRSASDGYLWRYVKKLPLIWLRALRTFVHLRHPIRRQTMQVVWKLREKNTKCPEEVFRIHNSYWISLLCYIFCRSARN